MKILRDEHGRQVQHNDMYKALGLDPNKHIPPDFHGFMQVEGVTVIIEKSKGGSKHRIFYWCGGCERKVPFGRAHQHMKGREHKLNCEIVAGRP